MRRIRASVILLLGFALLLVACKSDSGDGTSRSTPQPTAVAWRRAAQPITLQNASEIRLIGRIDTHAATVVNVQFSSNSLYLATSSLGADAKVRVWNLASGRDLLAFDGPPTNWLFFGPNDETLLTISREAPVSQIREWSIFDQELLTTLPAQSPDAIVTTVAQSADRTRLAIGGRYGRVYMFSADPLTSLEFIDAHPVVAVVEAAFTPDGERLVTMGSGGDVKVWDVETHELLHTFGSFDPPPPSLAISPDGNRLAIPSSSGMQIIGLDDYAVDRILPIETNSVSSYLQFSPDNAWIIGYGSGELASFWDVEMGNLVLGLPGHQNDIAGVAFSEDMRLVITGTRGANLYLWDLSVLDDIPVGSTETPQIPRLSLAPANTDLHLVAWSPNNEWIAFSDRLGDVYVMGVP